MSVHCIQQYPANSVQNERICATAIYYYDSNNITDNTLSFRNRADEEYIQEVSYEQGHFHHLSLFGFNPDCYVDVYERILGIFTMIKPKIHIAAIDLCMPIGMDACMTANVPWGILCPNSGLELSKFDQPMLKGFWKFPA